MKRTLMTHCLSGGGTHNIGYDAVRWENIVHGNCGEYGRYHELSVLPDKIARYLFDFDSDSYASLRLPEIPEDWNQANIHALMNPPHWGFALNPFCTCFDPTGSLHSFWLSQFTYSAYVLSYDKFCIFLHIFQDWALLDTLKLLQSAKHGGHLRMYSTLLIGHKNIQGSSVSAAGPSRAGSFKSLSVSRRQNMVMVRPTFIDKGGFQLRIDNVWFWRVLFLFSLVSQNDQPRKQHDCALVSVLEEYKGRRRPGCI